MLFYKPGVGKVISWAFSSLEGSEMKKDSAVVLMVIPASAMFLLVIAMSHAAHAQGSPTFSASYGYTPYMELSDPVQGTWVEDLEVRVGTLDIKTSYPLVFSGGRTTLANEISYRRLDFDYKNWDYGEDPLGGIEHAYAIQYTLTLLHGLSPKWSLMMILAPGLASDFEGDITSEDFTLETAVVFIRKFSERLSLGLGAAYSYHYGEPLPLPVLAFEWNNGSNLRARSIVPVNLEAWYAPREYLDLGLLLEVSGDQYHGDPDIYAPTEKPFLRYSIGFAGPSITVHLSRALHLNVTGGYTFEHRNEFFDDDDEVASYSLKNSGFVRAGVQLGG